MSDLLAHAFGIAALALNVFCMLCRCDVAMRRHSVLAGCLWALNNVLIGAHSAAALSMVSAGRTATSSATLDRSRVARRNMFLLFLGITIAAAAVTWTGPISVVTLAASMMSTYAMFYMHGAALRLSMLAASILWMFNAWEFGSWEQMAANVLTGCAAAYGAWTLARAKGQSATQAT